MHHTPIQLLPSCLGAHMHTNSLTCTKKLRKYVCFLAFCSYQIWGYNPSPQSQAPPSTPSHFTTINLHIFYWGLHFYHDTRHLLQCNVNAQTVTSLLEELIDLMFFLGHRILHLKVSKYFESHCKCSDLLILLPMLFSFVFCANRHLQKTELFRKNWAF